MQKSIVNITTITRYVHNPGGVGTRDKTKFLSRTYDLSDTANEEVVVALCLTKKSTFLIYKLG